MKNRRNKYFHCIVLVICLVMVLGFIGFGHLSGNEGFSGSELLGCGPDEILERLGVPESIGGSIWDLSYWYPTEEGKSEEVLLMMDGCTYWVKPGFERTSFKPVPSAGVYPGQKVHDLVKRVGQPDEVLHGQNSLTFVYRDGMNIDVAHGIVLHVEKKR